MPNTHSTLRGLFSDIADAIREKDGSSGTIVADTFPDAIRAIPTGGGGGAAESKDVNFIDYDGTIVYSYTAAEFAELTAMPSNPRHKGLTSQGWNWTLVDAQEYVSNNGKLYIGQMYITDDGKTRIYIHLEPGRLKPRLGLCPKGTVTIDWGDGKANTTLTGTSLTAVKWTSVHTYPAAGNYVITLTVDGSMNFAGSSTTNAGSYLLRAVTGADTRNKAYQSSIYKVEIGSGVTSLYTAAFQDCTRIQSITFPSGITGISDYVFHNCQNLRSITIPSGVATINDKTLWYCYHLATIAIPSSITQWGTSSFPIRYNYWLSEITISPNITKAWAGSFCYALKSVVIPEGVKTIGTASFDNCDCLISVTVPSSVTSIMSPFTHCYGLGEIRFKGTTPPSISSSTAFRDVPTDCKMYVPAESLSAYKRATNYPAYTYIGY